MFVGCSDEPAPVLEEKNGVEARAQDKAYQAQLKTLQKAQAPLLAQRAKFAAKLEEYTRGRKPEEYEQEPEFQSLFKRWQDLDTLVKAEQERARQVIKDRISK